MKTIVLVVFAAVVWFSDAGQMPVDSEGWRCEGDCPKEVKCAYCNPPRKKSVKKAAKKKAAKKSVKKSNKKEGAK